MPSADYDVIVVGAGPAGSTAAIAAAKNNLRTLLIDRERFPRDKACGDAVPMLGLNVLRDLGLNVFAHKDFFKVTHLFLKGPQGASVRVKLKTTEDSSAGMISRYAFDEMLFRYALDCGAEFCQISVTGPLMEQGQVVGITARAGKQTVEYRSKAVIAADGATSVIGRALNPVPRPDKHKAIALRGYVETDVDLDPTVELNFLGTFQPGYAWFFPMGKRLANIGVGMRNDHYKRQKLTLADGLAEYLKTPEIRDRVKTHPVTDVKSWQLPMASMDQQRVFNGAILVGDAGGLIDPLTGGGIRTAIFTGKFAADTIAHAIQANDLSAQGLAGFDQLYRDNLEAGLKRASLVANLASRFPPLIDLVVGVMNLAPGFGGLTGKL